MNRSFCFWDAKSLPDTIIIMANAAVTLALVVVCLFRMVQTVRKKYEVDEVKKKTFTKIHLLLTGWGFSKQC